MSPQELEQWLRELAEAAVKSRTVEDRRMLVARLLARQMRTADIHRFIAPAFGANKRTIDFDIAWARDWTQKRVKEMGRDAAMAEVLATSEEVVRQGFEKRDLQAVNTANRNKAELFGLTKNDDETPTVPLGVLVIPQAQDPEAWQKLAKAASRPAKR